MIPQPWRLLREGMNTGNQRSLFREPWLSALGTAVPIQHPTGAPFTRLVYLLR